MVVEELKFQKSASYTMPSILSYMLSETTVTLTLQGRLSRKFLQGTFVLPVGVRKHSSPEN